jgi:alpha-tubulin suppressor-like RCC1 family protein
MIPGLSAMQLAQGYDIGCALRTDGTIACWGANYFGGVGDGSYSDRGTPVAVSGVTSPTQVVTGADHACAVMSDGTVACWGEGDDGELGDGVMFLAEPSGVRMTCP